jgi:hypothetical protein
LSRFSEEHPGSVPASAKSALCSLRDAVEQLTEDRPSEPARRVLAGTGGNIATVSEFRKQILPKMDLVSKCIDQARKELQALLTNFPQSTEELDQIEKYFHQIQVTVEGITNPELQLPTHIMDWINFEDNLFKAALAGDLQALHPLLRALKNPDAFFRLRALGFLRHFEPSMVIESINAMLQDPDEDVRLEAAERLADLGDQRAIEPLIAFLGKRFDARARSALAKLGFY